VAEPPRHPRDVLADMYARQEMELIREHECDTCGAMPAEKCIRPDGRYQQFWTHPSRTRKALGKSA
jgi:hypothetical protein